MKEQIENFIKKIIKGETQFFDFETPSKYRDFKKQGISYVGDFFYSINKKEKECGPEGFFPKDLLPELPDLKNRYNSYVYDIDENIALIIQTRKGSISGVGFGEGWEVYAGILYHGITIKIYHYKTSKEQYEIDGVLFDDFYKWLDFSKFKEKQNYEYYFSDYEMFYNSKDNNMDFIKLLQLYQEGDSFYYYDGFNYVLNHDEQVTKEVEEYFSTMSFKKFIVRDEYRHKLDLPDTCNEIIFDFIEKKKTPNDFMSSSERDKKKQSIEALSKYKNLFLDKQDIKQADIIANKRELQKKAQENLKVVFNYKGISGIVFTNSYSYEKMLKHYEEKKEVVFNVLDQDVKIDFKDFKKTLSVDKIKKSSLKSYEYSSSYIGNFGVINWWNKKFEDLKEIY